MSPQGVRKWADKVGRLARQLDKAADDMEEAGVLTIHTSVQGIDTAARTLKRVIKTQFDRRVADAIEDLAEQDVQKNG